MGSVQKMVTSLESNIPKENQTTEISGMTNMMSSMMNTLNTQANSQEVNPNKYKKIYHLLKKFPKIQKTLKMI